MIVFVDTSALIALLDASDRHHAAAKKFWKSALISEQILTSTNYVLLEAFSLAQGRWGLPAARILNESFFLLLSVQWIDGIAHEAGLGGVFSANRKKLSLVDCTSFEVMRRLGIRKAFTFDRHFREQGFTCLP
ncbi:MAG: type II toxin-antitoxin system VapC family toxin [Thermoleophilia bacterium]